MRSGPVGHGPDVALPPLRLALQRTRAGLSPVCHTLLMAHKRFTVRLGERGRLVVPAEVRRSMGVKRGDLLALDLDENAELLEVRTAAEVARSARGVLRHLAPGADLTTELLEDRREEAEREDTADGHVGGR